MTTKTCNKCGETKPIDAFHIARRYADNHYPQCKECVAKYHKFRHETTGRW